MYLVNTVCIEGSTANEILLQNKVSDKIMVIMIVLLCIAKDIANLLKYIRSVYCG